MGNGASLLCSPYLKEIWTRCWIWLPPARFLLNVLSSDHLCGHMGRTFVRVSSLMAPQRSSNHGRLNYPCIFLVFAARSPSSSLLPPLLWCGLQLSLVSPPITQLDFGSVSHWTGLLEDLLQTRPPPFFHMGFLIVPKSRKCGLDNIYTTFPPSDAYRTGRRDGGLC